MFEKLVLIKCQTFAENYFIKLLFPKIGTFLCFRRSKHNLANKKLSSNRIPFDSCLIMKYLESPKMTRPTVQYIHICTVCLLFYGDYMNKCICLLSICVQMGVIDFPIKTTRIKTFHERVQYFSAL